MKTSLLAVLVSIALAAPTANASLLYFDVGMTGDQEVDAGGQFNQGDADGFGVAKIVIDTSDFTIDWEFLVVGIAMPLTGAHIHNAPAGIEGGVVVDFSAQLSGTGLSDVNLEDVVGNPSNFYVNLHNADFPAGAIRGQFSDPYRIEEVIPLPAAGWLLGSAMLGMVGLARRKVIA
jgi:hypothetical protein